MTGLIDAIARSPIPIDGGLGTRLAARGNDVTGELWSAEVLQRSPEEVLAAHRDYFSAGARAAITCSYQVTHEGFARAGVSADATDALLRSSVELARRAREQAGLRADEAWVLASVGPYGASRGDGSEYTGDYGDAWDEHALRRWHQRRIDVLAASGADALICETIPSLAEGRALVAATRDVRSAGVPVILSFTVGDGVLRSGEPVAAIAEIAADVPGVAAIGVNCAEVAHADRALRLLHAATELPLVVYPNSGEQWDAAARTWQGAARPIAGYAAEWVRLGARLIGGCCRVDVPEIEGIAAELSRLS